MTQAQEGTHGVLLEVTNRSLPSLSSKARDDTTVQDEVGVLHYIQYIYNRTFEY